MFRYSARGLDPQCYTIHGAKKIDVEIAHVTLHSRATRVTQTVLRSLIGTAETEINRQCECIHMLYYLSSIVLLS